MYITTIMPVVNFTNTECPHRTTFSSSINILGLMHRSLFRLYKQCKALLLIFVFFYPTAAAIICDRIKTNFDSITQLMRINFDSITRNCDCCRGWIERTKYQQCQTTNREHHYKSVMFGSLQLIPTIQTPLCVVQEMILEWFCHLEVPESIILLLSLTICCIFSRLVNWVFLDADT